MGWFSKDNENYNEGLKNAVEEYINSGRVSKLNEIKKYAKIKLKREQGFHPTHLQMLKDAKGSSNIGFLSICNIQDYDEPSLRLMYLMPQKYTQKYEESVQKHKEFIIENATTRGVSFVFPKIEQQKTDDMAAGALAGGLLFGVNGAIIGGAIGATNQQITEKIVPGETGKLKIAEKGIVLRYNTETVRIPWEDIKGMNNNRLELGEGKHVAFYEIYNKDIIAPIINERANYKDDDGW